MRPATRALELALLMRPMVQGAVARRALPGIVFIVVLLGVCTILAASIVLASLYAVYIMLIMQQFNQLHALVATIGFAVALLLGSWLAIRWRIHHLHAMSLPPAEKIAGAIDAFIEGFKNPGEK